MKAYLGNHSATAQEASKKELAKVECHKLNAAELKLDDAQVLRAYEVLFKVEQKMEVLKTEKLKEISTTGVV